MTKKRHTDKAIELSHQVMLYIIKHPEAVKDVPSDASFVVFSSEDKAFNRSNEGFLESVVAEGKPVVKVEQTKSKKEPWKFIPLTI